jgi:23S rRNA (guanine2445-N2)-methyltransferase / 23S rRNA (guanine2069-N7)-methyltransferase
VLAAEVTRLGVEVERVQPTTVHARGALRDGYRLCLWSRVASRVLLPVAEVEASDDDALYAALRDVPWWDHFEPMNTFAIGSSQTHGSPFPSHYWVQRAKDAIVDGFRDRSGARPSVDKKSPAIRFHLHIGERHHELSLDFSGEGLHRRGYRRAGGKAPLKENLAAAILHLAGWPEASRQGLALLDPTCGSGTFLAEAALMATECAPGLLRRRFGFESWLQHDSQAFEKERQDARAARKAECPAPIYGWDASERALADARENLRNAGVDQHVSLGVRELAAAKSPEARGILVCNPPYGHRLGDEGSLFLFYQQLGDTLKREFDGWTAYVFAARGSSLGQLGLRPARRHVLYNGAIECRLLELPIRARANASGSKGPAWRKPSDKALMFANRIRKNKKKWERWAKRNQVECYRLYDADIPEYSVAVDRYPERAVVHVFQKERDAGDPLARQRAQDVLLTLPEALGLDPADVIVKVRRKHDQGDQYTRLSQGESDMVVSESGLRFIVNLEDRIDTGLFLDHREVRAYAREQCRGGRMLNLFAYTCSVSVAAAAGGATQTTSVDLSNTYLDWGKRNFEANGIDPSDHRFFRNDANRWIAKNRDEYDWIFINPPTFSRSKMSKGAFNVHRDHEALIERAMDRLERGGELLFTTHARGFELSASLGKRFTIEEATRRLVPADFARYPFRAYSIRPASRA